MLEMVLTPFACQTPRHVRSLPEAYYVLALSCDGLLTMTASTMPGS
jgi:hypothetical protein